MNIVNLQNNVWNKEKLNELIDNSINYSSDKGLKWLRFISLVQLINAISFTEL